MAEALSPSYTGRLYSPSTSREVVFTALLREGIGESVTGRPAGRPATVPHTPSLGPLSCPLNGSRQSALDSSHQAPAMRAAVESLTQPCPPAPHAPTGATAFWLLHRAITASLSKAGFCFQSLPILKTLPRARAGEEGRMRETWNERAGVAS